MSKEDFTEEELNAVYKIVKQYKEETIDSSEESDNEYYGEYEESIPKNIVISFSEVKNNIEDFFEHFINIFLII